MFIRSTFTPISACTTIVTDLATQFFSLTSEQAADLRNTLSEHIGRFHDTLWVYIEYPYADRAYRDSYYHYFSTKFGTYPKHCIRLSFFDVPLSNTDFRNVVDNTYLQRHFLGFLVIRPTLPQVIGRNVISPRALKQANLRICAAEVPVTINAIKLMAVGFPHASQDTETVTCAETTVWALMEYFGHRYANYQPVLPSEIVSILRAQSYERQWPSKGLVVEQISFALREFGFATRIYARSAHKDEFLPLLSCYIESGIPVAVAIHNGRGIAHALLCIGREPLDPANLPNTPPRTETKSDRTLHIVDNDLIAKNFVFIDDNLPTYVKANLNQPASNYPYTDWNDCEVVSFIVPLYSKVYLEAYEAKQLVETFLHVGPYPLPDEYTLFLRFFLTSNRSYKEYIATNSSIQSELKTFILALAMPKFIWVAELSSDMLIKQSLADGVVILDATEANVLYNKPLLFAAYQNRLITFAAENDIGTTDEAIDFPISPFAIYENNLKSFA